MIDWLLVPRHAAILNLFSLIAGGMGLFFALWGIKIALKQLAAIKTETEVAAASIASVQIKVASLDVAKECQAAMALIIAIRAALRKNEWSLILSSYEDLIESFLRLGHSSHLIDQDHGLLMVKMTEDMANICTGIRKVLDNPESTRSPRGQDQALRNFSDALVKLSFLVTRGLQK